MLQIDRGVLSARRRWMSKSFSRRPPTGCPVRARSPNSSSGPPGYWEFAGLHDLLHVRGFVDVKAPHFDGWSGPHVRDGQDLMHGGPDPWGPSLLDRNNDDYYGPKIPAGILNLYHDPMLVPASASTLAQALAQSRAQAITQPQPIPRFIHGVVEQPRRR